VKVRALVLAALLAGALVSAGDAATEAVPDAVILSTGEFHAAVHPNTGRGWPDGGLARRAGMIARIRKSSRAPVFLFDSGGFSAGGAFDRNTLGPAIDRIRTELTVDAMAAMGYDAVAVGEEELSGGEERFRELAASGRLPLVCANLLDAKTGKPVCRPWIMVERGGLKVGVFGVIAPETQGVIARRGCSLKVANWIATAKKLVPAIRAAGADLVVALSHVSECRTGDMIRAAPGIDFAVNGNRKSWQMPGFAAAGGAYVVQFDFESRRLGVCTVTRAPRARGLQCRAELRRLGPDVRNDARVAKLVADAARKMAAAQATGCRVKADLYIRPDCPYCGRAEKALFRLAAELPELVRLNVRFILKKDREGRLSAMHGEAELAETRRQAAIRRLHPAKLAGYIAWRRNAGGKPDWKAGAASLGIDAAAVEKMAAAGEADRLLGMDIMLAKWLKIGGSPTLYLNNRLYEGAFTRENLLMAIGRLLPERARPAACAAVPACFGDADCVRPGYVGTCVDPGEKTAKRVFEKAARVSVRVLSDSRATHTNGESIVRSLLTFLPGLEVERVDYAAAPGRALAQKHDIRRLPAYVLGPGAKKARHYKRISAMLRESGGMLVTRPALVGSHQFISRARKPGRLDVFFAPGFADGFRTLLMALDGAGRRDPAPEVRVRHAVFRKRGGELAMAGGIAEIEEAMRQVVIRERFGAGLRAYLAERAKLPGSSYWRDPLVAAGLDAENIRRLSRSDWVRKSLEDDAKVLDEIMTRGPSVFLVSNQEVVPAEKLKDVNRILDHLSAELRSRR